MTKPDFRHHFDQGVSHFNSQKFWEAHESWEELWLASQSDLVEFLQGLIAQGDLAEFSWAPVLVAWGKNNRSAMLRLPGNRHCIENRAVDMSVNP